MYCRFFEGYWKLQKEKVKEDIEKEKTRMNLIDIIPIGRKYKMTRQELMYKTKITDIKEFKEEISKLRKQYIIIFDNGYYLPSSKEEYLKYIEKETEKMHEISKRINLAYKEMGELEDV